MCMISILLLISFNVRLFILRSYRTGVLNSRKVDGAERSASNRLSLLLMTGAALRGLAWKDDGRTGLGFQHICNALSVRWADSLLESPPPHLVIRAAPSDDGAAPRAFSPLYNAMIVK